MAAAVQVRTDDDAGRLRALAKPSGGCRSELAVRTRRSCKSQRGVSGAILQIARMIGNSNVLFPRKIRQMRADGEPRSSNDSTTQFAAMAAIPHPHPAGTPAASAASRENSPAPGWSGRARPPRTPAPAERTRRTRRGSARGSSPPRRSPPRRRCRASPASPARPTAGAGCRPPRGYPIRPAAAAPTAPG